jgi:hypothetical protein
LQSLENRFDLIRPGMKRLEARRLAEQSTQAYGDGPGGEITLLKILTEIIEIRRRVRLTARAAVAFQPSASGKEQILSDLADVETEIDHFKQFLTGMSVDEAIAKIMESNDA